MGSGLYNLSAARLGLYGINNSALGAGAYGIANNNALLTLNEIAIERQQMAAQRSFMMARGVFGGGIIVINEPTLRDEMTKDVDEYLKDWDK